MFDLSLRMHEALHQIQVSLNMAPNIKEMFLSNSSPNIKSNFDRKQLKLSL